MKPSYAWPDPDRDYANGAFIAEADSYAPTWAAVARAFRANAGTQARLDLPYGPGPQNRFDLFLPARPPAGVIVFVHGGYWMAFGRDSWSNLAAGALSWGWAVAMPSYTLAPEARISRMTAEIAAACKAIATEVPGPMVVTGHSAGGHLAARMGCADIDAPVRRVVPISPLAELGPLMATKMNDTLHLDAAECAVESPARLALRPGVSAHVWVGGNERPAFLWQARVLAEEWGCGWTVDADRHHFDVIDSLADAHSPLIETLLKP
ncbi:MAG: alpha/beta hydrolase [Paracoccaceae bacterium]